MSIPHLVDTAWLAERLDDPNLRLFDTTTILNIKEGGADIISGLDLYKKEHIPGAVFADLTTDLSDSSSPLPFTVPSFEQFKEVAGRLGVGPNTYVVVYDQGAPAGAPIYSSMWASRLWWQFRYAGINNVAVLAGGLAKWKEEGRPVTSEITSYPETTFVAEPQPQLLAKKADVIASLDDPNVILIDSLSAEDHAGTTNTYPRNGHIPGSVNVFFGDVSDPEGQTLREPEQLQELFAAVGALDPNRKVITYCGGGIGATWVTLALAHAGRTDVAVYDGSRNEWASDPTLPIATK